MMKLVRTLGVTAAAAMMISRGAQAQTATQVVTFQVDPVNQIAITGAPALLVNVATAGSAPTSVQAAGSQWAITTNQSGAKVTALEYGPLAAEYIDRYKEWVTFVKPIPHGEVGDFLCRFDVVIGQMKQGILSLMEIEALAAGRPVITALDRSL